MEQWQDVRRREARSASASSAVSLPFVHLEDDDDDDDDDDEEKGFEMVLLREDQVRWAGGVRASGAQWCERGLVICEGSSSSGSESDVVRQIDGMSTHCDSGEEGAVASLSNASFSPLLCDLLLLLLLLQGCIKRKRFEERGGWTKARRE